MSYENVGKLVDRWLNDPQFRVSLRKDPQTAVRESGVKLSEDELKAFNSIDWSVSDEELKSRIVKGM